MFLNFVNSETELTTAFTDLGLAFVILVGIYYLKSNLKKTENYKNIFFIFIYLALASFLGFIVHGIQMSETINFILWQFLNFSLAYTMIFFLLAILYDWEGKLFIQKNKYYFYLLAFVFFIISMIFNDSFLPFVIYEASIMLFILFYSLKKYWQSKKSAYLFFTLFILFSIFAAIEQALKLFSFNLIWQFDHNSVFHLIEIFSIFFLFKAFVLLEEKKASK